MDASSDWVVSGGKGALDFDGSNDSVGIPNSPSINVGASGSPCTYSIWFFKRTSGISGPFFRGDAQYVYVSGTSFAVSFGNGEFFVSGFVVNTWQHLLCTWDGNTVARVFVNGNQVGSRTAAAGGITYGQSIILGARLFGSTWYMDGLIDDFTIYNAALTASEVREVYRRGRGYGIGASLHRSRRSASGFKAYWARRQSQLIGGGV